MGHKKEKEVIEIESEGGSEEEQYFVEVITRAKVVVGGQFEYRVKWWNYSDDANTWEPYENVKNCTRLLKSFWKEVGKEHKKNPGPLGEEYIASDKWVEEEKRIFQRDLEKENETTNEVEEIEEVEEIKPPKKDKKKKRDGEARAPKDDGHGAPSTSTAPPRDESKVHHKKVVHISGSDSEDDRPLKKKVKFEKSKKASVPERRGSTSVASSAGANDEDRQDIDPLTAARNKYSSLKMKKIPRKESNSGGGFTLKSAPRLTEDEINLHRSKQVPPPRVTQDVDLSNSEIYGSLFLSSQSQQDYSIENPPLNMDDADNFLETIKPRAAAAALHPSELAKAEASKPVPPPPRPFVNKWKWDGELFLKTDGELAEGICNIRLEEPFDVNGDGFKFEILMDGKDSLRFNQLSSTFEIGTILHALRRVDQFASLCHAGPTDRDALLTFRKYMWEKRLCARSAVITDFGHVAEMILFPVESELSGHLSVPLSLTNHAMLIVALMPWVVPPSSYIPLKDVVTGDRGIISRSKELIDEWLKVLDPRLASSILIADLHYLGFPKWLLKSVRGKSYCIWARSVEPVPKDSGRTFSGDLRRETSALLNVLTASEASNVGYKKDLHFVFVHVGAMKTLNMLEALVERRCKRPEIQFFTYGQHHSVKPYLWGIQEIYPIGGVVTFTHMALLEDPFGTAELIMKLHRHPLWVAYILPSALALFVRLSSHPSNPIEMFKTEPFRFGRILHLIDEGNISLLQSPPLNEQPKTARDRPPEDEWMVPQIQMLGKSSEEIVQDCWITYISRFSNKSDSEASTSLHAEILEDLVRMQMQPSIRKDYRRFVVIKGESESDIAWDKGGFEWQTLKSFNFRDDFFGKEQPPNANKTRTV